MDILFYAAATVAAPHLLLFWLLRRRPPGRGDGLVGLVLVSALVLAFFGAGAWIFSSAYLRYVLLAEWAAVAVTSCVRLAKAPATSAGDHRVRRLLRAALTVPALALAILALCGRCVSRTPIDLEFPLGPGTYGVIQGGSNPVTNPFHTLVGSRFALDIVKLRWWGNRADTLVPRTLGDYAIYGAPLLSPCNGQVIAALDGAPDASPAAGPALGNHVWIRCQQGVRVVLAHLRQDSVAVVPGQAVRAGEPVGQVGNSGLSGEPHLHIQAILEADAAPDGRETPVPLRFRGRLLSVNQRIRIPGS